MLGTHRYRNLGQLDRSSVADVAVHTCTWGCTRTYLGLRPQVHVAVPRGICGAPWAAPGIVRRSQANSEGSSPRMPSVPRCGVQTRGRLVAMSPHRIEVPVTFPSAFLRSDGIAAGLSEWVLRSPRFNRPFHGVRTAVVQRPPGAAGTSTANTTALHLAAARDYYPRLRDTEIYSHETALLFLGCPIRVAHRPHVSVLAPRNASRTRGVVGHQHGAPISCVLVDQHLPVAPPQQALLQAVPSMSLAEVVVAID